ncbi:peroxiredoxin-like family protein [Arthrobacter sp. 260]|uniref:peroxiredoxin-like family protein n=1 Tax=Arthrobacter sp. 260 TaxID=2735314 RepID=UPI001491EB37|nr:peroxiredoxin-like family protein [Arthrobacter sp. 260]NOJ61162.1 AhpC/TSA family protein [Arthrobacter sp. 260]
MSHSSTSIKEQVAEFNQGFDSQIGKDLAGTFAAEQADLRSAGVPVEAVTVGEQMPDALLLRRDGNEVKLSEVLSSAPAVLVFYRGAWCPYCNITLKTYQSELLPSLVEQDIKLIAISPQHPTGSEAAVQAGDLDFEVLSDPANGLAFKLGIVTEPSSDARSAHTKLGFNVADSNTDGTPAIPFPTVLIVDAGGTVRFVDIHTDYTTRSEVPDILRAVESL